MDNAMTLNHLNITVANLERSINFYRDILGFEYVTNLGPSKVVLRYAGFDFFIEEVPGDIPRIPGFHFGLKTDRQGVFSFGDLLKEHGVPLVQGNNPSADVWALPDTGRAPLYFEDPDGWMIEVYSDV
jgi:catechol 2,3-dioxygenase-like lactoylglutathione lyase family enzyme